MNLTVAWRLNPYADDERVEVAGGQWQTVEHDDADELWDTLLGAGPGEHRLELDGEEVTGRHAAGGVTMAACRLDPVPTMRVADVVGLGLVHPRLTLWQTLLGTRRARAQAGDDEARIRALAGRTGIAGWVDRTAVDLPPAVAAMVDVTRALAGPPSALLLRRPQWLGTGVVDEVTAVVAAEQAVHGFAVVEIVQRRPGSLPPA